VKSKISLKKNFFTAFFFPAFPDRAFIPD